MGDGLGLFHYPVLPDIQANLSNIDSVRAFYRRSVREVGLGVVEIDTVVVDSCTAVRTLFKVAQNRRGAHTSARSRSHSVTSAMS